MDNSKIMARIAKLASKPVENGCTLEEAAAAAKMVQKLIAKYHIDMTEYKDEQEAIDKEGLAYTRDWQNKLLAVLSKNYCCEAISSRRGGKKQVYIMGRTTDRKTCIAMFNMFSPLIRRGIQEAKEEAKARYGTYSGVEFSYAAGYIKAIQEELEKQTRALCLVVPVEVTEELHRQFNVKTVRKSVKVNHNIYDYAENKGYRDGREASRKKAIA